MGWRGQWLEQSRPWLAGAACTYLLCALLCVPLLSVLRCAVFCVRLLCVPLVCSASLCQELLQLQPGALVRGRRQGGESASDLVDDHKPDVMLMRRRVIRVKRGTKYGVDVRNSASNISFLISRYLCLGNGEVALLIKVLLCERFCALEEKIWRKCFRRAWDLVGSRLMNGG